MTDSAGDKHGNAVVTISRLQDVEPISSDIGVIDLGPVAGLGWNLPVEFGSRAIGDSKTERDRLVVVADDGSMVGVHLKGCVTGVSTVTGPL
jgi:hypothetical protein